MTYLCPLCKSPENRPIEELHYALLRRLYRKLLQIDLGDQRFAVIELRACGRCDLRFYTPPFIGDEGFYDSLQRFDWYYLEEKDEYDFAARHISATDRVLEVGIGHGAFAEKIPSESYEGLELSEAAVNMARQRGCKRIASSAMTKATRPPISPIACSGLTLYMPHSVARVAKNDVRAEGPRTDRPRLPRCGRR